MTTSRFVIVAIEMDEICNELRGIQNIFLKSGFAIWNYQIDWLDVRLWIITF